MVSTRNRLVHLVVSSEVVTWDSKGKWVATGNSLVHWVVSSEVLT